MGVCESVQHSKTKNQIFTKNKKNNNNYSCESTKNSSIYSKRTDENSQDYILTSDLAIHDDINKYFNIDKEIIGNGASGFIVKGENKKGKFAIKRILKKNCKYTEDLIFEAKISKILNHKNIVKYYSIFEDKEYISFVMELGENGDLFDFIVNSPLMHIPLKICIEITEQLLSSLNYLHNTLKIIHRDLKPENILIKLDKNNNIICKLIDFGMSTQIIEGKKLNDFLGTLNYCSPELILKKGYTEKSDIWSLGIIIFNLLTGCEAFKYQNDEELIDNIKYEDIKFDNINNNEMRYLLKQMLNKNDNERIDSKEALKNIQKIKENIKYSENDEKEYKVFINYLKKKYGLI